jgi:two-component system KDP operon response regulator KdpE
VDRKILIVDDEPAFVRFIGSSLSHKGYKVLTADNGQEALRLLFAQKPDLVLLDVVMPKMDGWQTCNRIRELSDVPIVIVTGRRKSESDIARWLEHGADDYLIKPVGNKELAARVSAILRRAVLTSRQEQKAAYCDKFLTVDIDEHRVTADGERLRLTPTEFKLLAILVENAGIVLTHKRLLEKVWGWEYTDDIDHVRIYIWHLRHKIEPDPTRPRYIITEAGVGYYFKKAV